MDLLSELVPLARQRALTIADAKRGDIGNSAAFYARFVFDRLGFDSITVAPYMGRDSVEPFLTRPGTCAFVLVRTSNPGGDNVQLLDSGGMPVYEHVARHATSWAESLPADAGFVVGATDLGAMARLRASHPDVPFLIPGVGAQGGSAREVMAAAAGGPVLVNSSRSILYASNEEEFAQDAGRVAAGLAADLRPATRHQAHDVHSAHYDQMLYRTVRMTFQKEHTDTFIRLFEDAKPRIEAFGGCRSLLLLRDAEHPNVFTTVSTWTSDDALQAYRSSDFFRKTWSRTRALFSERPVAHSYCEHFNG